MTNISTKLSLALISLFALSCSLQDHVLPPASPDVYVAGWERIDGPSGPRATTYWKNGSSNNPLLTSTEPASIAVANGDVHIVRSHYDSGVAVGLYWKNNVLTSVSNTYKPKLFNSVVVSGSDVYIAGSGDVAGSHQAMYWKNGQPVRLDKGAAGSATGIAIQGGDVYVCGTVTPTDTLKSVAKYWKNGSEVLLSDSTSMFAATAIAVSGNDVHVVGYEYTGFRRIAKYWKNGVASNLGNALDSRPNDIAILGNDVYVVGQEYTTSFGVAKLWKNGVEIPLPGGRNATGIMIVGTDIYISGVGPVGNTSGGIAKYWKNGVAVELTDGSNDAFASDIFVVSKP